MSERRLARFKHRVISWNPLKKSLFIIVIGILAFGTVIMLDGTIGEIFGQENMHPDIQAYRNRTSTILDGGLLYTDVHTETPPLINYLMIPAQLLGGDENVLVYSAYFSFFSILGGLLMYLALRRYDDTSAFIMSLLYMLSPFSLLEGGLANDETIVAFTVVLPAILIVINRSKIASLIIGLGIWTKMWAILLAPVHFLHSKTWKERLTIIAIIGGVSIAVAAPFLALCGDEFTWFLKYYFMGDPERTNEGFSAHMFLELGGISIPNVVSIALVLAGLLIAYFYAYWKGLGKWESMTLAIVVFFCLYHKMHGGYYLIPIAFLVAWGSTNWKIAARCFLLYVPVMLAVAFAPPMVEGDAFIHFEGSWIVGLIFAISANILLLETTYVAMKEKSFITRGIERLEESDSIDEVEKTSTPGMPEV
ncbi:MAG: DUF2029 domain-containing protein [Euryarchaeota archaeon]|nr:DUF2029 domain-containing protein [Euryarchaeota archaeon]